MSILKKSLAHSLAIMSMSLLALVTTGCGDSTNYDTGLVTGTVTLDGSPLANASLIFSPEGGSTSTGITDSSGKYELVYTRSAMGAEPGSHSVSITTYDSGDPEGEPPVAVTPEKVPTIYNSETKLVADVVKGKNSFDFDLKTEGGKVEQPDEGNDE